VNNKPAADEDLRPQPHSVGYISGHQLGIPPLRRILLGRAMRTRPSAPLGHPAPGGSARRSLVHPDGSFPSCRDSWTMGEPLAPVPADVVRRARYHREVGGRVELDGVGSSGIIARRALQ